jgi:lysyl-tRNA synthetase class 2
LNNPFDQRLRFEEQARQKAQGDDEAYVSVLSFEK